MQHLGRGQPAQSDQVVQAVRLDAEQIGGSRVRVLHDPLRSVVPADPPDIVDRATRQALRADDPTAEGQLPQSLS